VEKSMAQEETAPVTETVQQQVEDAFSDSAIDSMLAGVPGLEKYFGAAESETPPVKETAARDSVPVAPQAESSVVRDEILAGGGEGSPPAAQPEPKEGEPPVPQEEGGEPEEVSANVQKRIDRLVAQKHEALEKASGLESKVSELEARLAKLPALGPTPENPLASVDSMAELEKRLIDAKRVKSWALENLDGGQVQNKEGEGTTYLDGSQVKKLLSMSEELITTYIPDRARYLNARTDYEQQARSYYPDLYKPNTEANLTLANWIRVFPEVLRFPDFQLIIADALVGQKIRFNRLKAASNGNSKAAPTNVSPKTPTLAAPSPSAGARVPQKSVLSKDLLNRIATDRSALDIFSESLIQGREGSK
jgi:hypothetical protein